MKILISILFLLLAVSSFSVEKDDDYYKEYTIRKGNITIIAFLDPINCIKCKLNIDNMIKCLDSKIPLNKKISIVGFMRINRKVEFNYYKKNLNWQYPIFIANDNFNNEMGIKNNMDFIILSEQRKVIYQNNLSAITNIGNECKEVMAIIEGK